MSADEGVPKKGVGRRNAIEDGAGEVEGIRGREGEASAKKLGGDEGVAVEGRLGEKREDLEEVGEATAVLDQGHGLLERSWRLQLYKHHERMYAQESEREN